MRHDVVVHGDERGFVTLGTGVAGRRELSIEVVSRLRGTGAGRALLGAALGAVPHGEPVFAVVSPGNARSLRAFLSQGFAPIGSEVLITRPGRPDPSQDRGDEADDVGQD
jgi:GNAT superfamily N-acetyltransferase